MNQPPYSPPPYGYPPPPPMGPPPPDRKRPFRFQMWMLGALIVPVGIGLAVRDVVKRSSLELGEECANSDHCKSHTCLTGDLGVCTKTCSTFDACPAGFSCQNVSVTLHNQGGFHDLGAQGYCLKGAAPPAASSAPPDAAAPLPPPPAPAASSAAHPAPSATPKPKPSPKPAKH